MLSSSPQAFVQPIEASASVQLERELGTEAFVGLRRKIKELMEGGADQETIIRVIIRGREQLKDLLTAFIGNQIQSNFQMPVRVEFDARPCIGLLDLHGLTPVFWANRVYCPLSELSSPPPCPSGNRGVIMPLDDGRSLNQCCDTRVRDYRSPSLPILH